MLKQSKTILVTSLLVMAAAQSAHANPDLSNVTLQDVGYGGNGCPAGSASVTISPDKQSVSVLFDEYIAEAGGQGQRTFSRMKCDIAFSLKVPNGISVSLIDADYRGFMDLPRGARADFSRDYFFAGARGPSLKSNWNGQKSDDYLIKDRLGVMANVWSPCGASVILRSKTAASVRTNRGNEAMLTVDSVDLTTKTTFKYNFQYRTCS
ncbi:DUF4360 domain-containing protein [Leucothrix mucor]|jgi:hypothetical protein|uniref:DUF4360 domain-containing protein n=1 Tax=Leucothrix mucor TaxID=45248 RepID=UPI0003B452C6|nr:DUF4360 domain-containing protein [Leucothrix mucor]